MAGVSGSVRGQMRVNSAYDEPSQQVSDGVGSMGQSRKRVGRNGDVRYTAYYEDARGHRRSAGTFTSLKAANKAWQQAEAKVAEGRGGVNPTAGGCSSSATSRTSGFPIILLK